MLDSVGQPQTLSQFITIEQERTITIVQDKEDRIIPPSTSIKKENVSNTPLLSLMKYLLTLEHR